VEVWQEPSYPSQVDEDVTYDEETYVSINDWCKQNFGYHARTAYHIFELKKKQHLDWFLLRWS
jgi:hypothetical protein